MIKPIRIQRSRKHKQVSPNGLEIVYVGRPTKFGNPFKIGEPIDNLNLIIDDRSDFNYYSEGRAILSRQEAVELFVRHCTTPKFKALIKKELSGKNLSCWCPLSCECHADTLLKIANK